MSKGSRDRVTDKKKFDENYEKVVWGLEGFRQRLNKFYHDFPVGLCPECGGPSRLARISNGPCLSCVMDVEVTPEGR